MVPWLQWNHLSALYWRRRDLCTKPAPVTLVPWDWKIVKVKVLLENHYLRSQGELPCAPSCLAWCLPIWYRFFWPALARRTVSSHVLWGKKVIFFLIFNCEITWLRTCPSDDRTSAESARKKYCLKGKCINAIIYCNPASQTHFKDVVAFVKHIINNHQPCA